MIADLDVIIMCVYTSNRMLVRRYYGAILLLCTIVVQVCSVKLLGWLLFQSLSMRTFILLVFQECV